MQLGIISQREGQFDRSVGFLAHAIQANPKLAKAHYRLGLAYTRLGQGDKAKLEFEVFKKLDSESQTEPERRQIIQFLVKGRL